MAKTFTAFKIDRGVPLPQKRGSKSPVIAAMKDMGVGDSFICPAQAQTYISAIKRRYFKEREYVTRTLDDGQVRVWRTA